MEFFNASLEPPFSRQFDGQIYHFHPRQKTFVPDHLNWQLFLDTQNLKQYGVFPILPGMTNEQIKTAEIKALKEYRHTGLRERIRNYMAEADEARRHNVTLEKSEHYERALRLTKELDYKLKIEAPRDDEWSFLSKEEREKLGITDSQVKHLEGQNLFDRDTIIEQNQEVVTRKPGRPAKKVESFNEVNIGQI